MDVKIYFCPSFKKILFCSGKYPLLLSRKFLGLEPSGNCVMSCCVVPCCVGSCRVMLCCVVSYRIVSYHTISDKKVLFSQCLGLN